MKNASDLEIKSPALGAVLTKSFLSFMFLSACVYLPKWNVVSGGRNTTLSKTLSP